MRRSWIPPRQPGPLPEILLAENDEVLSSWLTRLAALYRVRPDTLLEQLGISEVVPAVLDRRALPMDLERLSVAVRSSPEAIRRMTFTDETPEALEFVTHRFPLWTCRWCVSEFSGPRSGPSPTSHMVHRCRVTMQALWRTTHPCSSPNQSGPAEYHRRWRAL